MRSQKDPSSANPEEQADPLIFEADDSSILHQICGGPESPIASVEHNFGVQVLVRDHTVKIFGSVRSRQHAAEAIRKLLHADPELRTRRVQTVQDLVTGKELLLPGGRRVRPRNARQQQLIDTALGHPITFSVGPAGTGKTFVAVALALALYRRGDCSRVILTRPAVEAGESLGFLPGDLEEKISPYLRPLYDAMYAMVGGDKIGQMAAANKIEIAPLAYMRGRTLSRAVVILDEAQNTTAVQMKMFLTRLGPESRAIITGDLTQTDLPRGEQSGLRDALARLRAIEGIGTVAFGERDVVRHAIVRKILAAYRKK